MFAFLVVIVYQSAVLELPVSTVQPSLVVLFAQLRTYAQFAFPATLSTALVVLLAHTLVLLALLEPQHVLLAQLPIHPSQHLVEFVILAALPIAYPAQLALQAIALYAHLHIG